MRMATGMATEVSGDVAPECAQVSPHGLASFGKWERCSSEKDGYLLLKNPTNPTKNQRRPGTSGFRHGQAAFGGPTKLGLRALAAS